MQLGHVALGHHIEQMSFAQVVDTAILRGQFNIHMVAEGLLNLAADLIAMLLQAVDQEGHPEQQVVQLVVKLAGGLFAPGTSAGLLLALAISLGQRSSAAASWPAAERGSTSRASPSCLAFGRATLSLSQRVKNR